MNPRPVDHKSNALPVVPPRYLLTLRTCRVAEEDDSNVLAGT